MAGLDGVLAGFEELCCPGQCAYFGLGECARVDGCFGFVHEGPPGHATVPVPPVLARGPKFTSGVGGVQGKCLDIPNNNLIEWVDRAEEGVVRGV